MRLERTLWLVIFLTPALGLMVIFTVLPAVTALGYSLYSWTSFNREAFVGLENFRKLFSFPFQSDFLRALGHNLLAFVGLMVVQNGVGLLLAYALWRQPPFFKFFRATVFLPVILSLVVVGFLWLLFLDPLIGPLTKAANALGIASFAPLGDPRYALLTLMLVNAWRWVGFPALVFLAGMNNISEEYFEAARLDGATEGQVFRRIMLPLLAPAFTIIVLLTFIGAMEWFELPYVMAGVSGNPDKATDTLGLMFYRMAFGAASEATSNVGVAAAISVILFVIVGVGSALGSRVLRSREVEL
ncbi:MAG: sugar ABC transporter permease [Thermaceae bacterium]|nr:sugar ABC transporter permease [Thermaceae bacterium]